MCVSGARADGGQCSPHLAHQCMVGCAPLGRQEIWLLELAKADDFGFSKDGFLQSGSDELHPQRVFLSPDCVEP